MPLMSRAPFNPVKVRPFGTVARCVAELFKQAGGIKAVVVKLGVQKSVAYGYTEEGTDAAISFAKVAALTSPQATAAAAWLAHLAGGVFCPMPEGRSGDALALTSDAARANGEAIASVIEVLRDGRITPDERAKVLPLVEAALCDLSALRGFLASDDAQDRLL
ncbi:MAG: hypothetical protein WCL04_05060 [Verrucomicrobiota bacterium]